MYIRVKKIIDKIFALFVIIILCIPMLIISIAIKIEDRGAIIYKSKRIGKDLKEIYIYKFRSMKCNRKEMECNMSHREMTTKIGKFIRKTGLDELPQLFNILRGEMSFIGPRPWIPEYYKWFDEEQKKRASVLPGISGLAQIKGKNRLRINEKIDYDIEYIENMNFFLDVEIVLITICQFFRMNKYEMTEIEIKQEIEELKNEIRNKKT